MYEGLVRSSMHGDDADADASGPSRRAYLRRGCAAVGVGLAFSTAGCTATLPPLGQRVRYGRVDAPPRSKPVYRRWVPDPSLVRQEYEDDEDELSLLYSTPGNLGKETLGEDFTLGLSLLIARVDYFGIPLEDYDWTLTMDGGAVLRGDIRQDTVEGLLRETIYERAGTYEGFSLFRRETGDTWVAVSPTTIVHSGGEFGRENLETIVDAGQGTVARSHEVDESLARFTERVGANPFTWYGTDIVSQTDTDDEDGPRIPEAGQGATTFAFDEKAAYFTYDLLYESGNLPTRRDIRANLERDTRPLSSAAVDIEYEDPFVRVEMRVPAGRMRARADDESSRGPYVTWRAELDESEAVIRFHNLAGDAVPVERLTLRGVRGREPTFHTTDGTLDPGDHLSVSVAGNTGDTVRLVWESPTGNASMTLDSVEVPAGFRADTTEGSGGT
jgi:hypothetical protein